MMLRSTDLRDLAADLGLEVAAAPPEAGPEALAFRRWLSDGRHGEMAWLARDPARRLDARAVLPEARSVISVAASYDPGPVPLIPGAARIARYALGDDYHDVLLDRVLRLRDRLADPLARAYVDTGPVLEKAKAARAGLGWIGKHSNLVSRRFGSWFFLGAIVTAREAEPGEPHRDHCGTCTRCFHACPTGAIREDEPGRLDARLCISYLTIELRGPIPRELRPLIGTWVFGCDLCTEVCPWNRFSRPTRELRLHPRPELLGVPLIEMIQWDDPTFLRLTKGMAIRRTKRRGLLRNAAVALGNLGDPGVVPVIAERMEREHEPLILGHLAWALGRLGGSRARGVLERTRRHGDAGVVAEVEAALASLP